MEASSIITQVTREEDQITSFAQEKGMVVLLICVGFAGFWFAASPPPRPGAHRTTGIFAATVVNLCVF